MSERTEYPIKPTPIERSEAMTPTEVRIRSGNTEVVLSPDKGGFVSEFSVNGENILYEDEGGYNNPNNMKLKGGIPVLFPYAGPRESSTIWHDEKKDWEIVEPIQHGGAREVPVWALIDSTEDSVIVSLDSENIKNLKLPSMVRGETVGQFEGKDAGGNDIIETLEKLYGEGYRFYLEIKVTVSEGILRYDFCIKNLSDKAMPFAPGLHPYFKADHDKRGQIVTNLEDFDLTKIKEKTQKADRPAEGLVSFTLPDGTHIDIDSSSEFKKFVGWALTEDSDYICIEPFVADPKEPGDDEIWINPLETKELFVEFRVKH